MSVTSESQNVSRKPGKEGSQHRNEIEDGHDDTEPASQLRSTDYVPLERDSHSQTSKISSKFSHKELSKTTYSEKSSMASRARSDLGDGKTAMLLPPGSRYIGQRKERSTVSGKGNHGKQSVSKSSSSKILPGLMISKSKAGELLLDEWKDHGLSSDEMRNKLFASFKSKGILNGAKLQIRADLASVINEKQILKTTKNSKVVSFASKISDCIVAEHLKKSEYEYSLSVFKAEGLLSDFDFHPHEILDIMKLNPNSKVYQNLMMYLSQRRCKSFLWSFISEMISGKIGETTSTECQTVEHIPITSRDVDFKVSEIEKDVLKSNEGTIMQDHFSLEERLFDLQQKMESQKKKELIMEKQRLRNELVREIHLEEQEKSRFELDRHKSEIEEMYREMFTNLKEKETQMDLIISRKRKQLEEEAYAQRQNILEEMKKIKEREGDIQKQHEFAMTSVNLEETKLRSIAEELKVKEMAQRTIEERYEIKFQQEILNYKNEQQQERQKFEEFYRQQESKLNEEKALFQSEKASLINYQNEFETVKYRNKQLQESLQSSQQQLYILNQTIADMKEKLQDTADYPKLKEKMLLKDKEIDYLKKSLNEVRNDRSSIEVQHRKDMKDLIDRFLKSTPETAKLQQQILLEREEFMEKEKELKLKYREVTKRLQEENLKNMEVMHMYEECLLQNKALKREIGDLKQAGYHVFMSQNPHSNNLKPYEYKHAKGSPLLQPYAIKRPIVGAESEGQLKSQTLHMDKAAHSPQETLHDHRASSNTLLASNDVAHIGEELAAFERLEKEAASLEQMYHNFKAEKNFMFSRESDIERPKTNDFRPLQKYESSLKQDFSAMLQEADKDSISEGVVERNFGRSYSSSQVLVAHDRGNAINYQMRTGSIDNWPKKDKVVLDTWNAHRVTEYLDESATIGNDEGGNFQILASKSSVFKSKDSTNTGNDLHAKEVTKSAIGTVVDSDSIHMERQGWDGQEVIMPFGNKMSSEKESEHSTFTIESEHVTTMREGGDKDSESKYYQNGNLRKDVLNLDNHVNVEIPSLIKEESFDENSVESKHNSQRLEQKYDREKMLSKSIDSQLEEDTAKIDYDEHDTSRKEADDEIITNAVGGHDRTVDNGQNEDKSEGDGEDDHIDPLMKHYMEMVLKAKNMAGEELEKDRSNLTDDTKIESKLSRSDVSDLIEDKIEELQIDSADEFDW